MDIGERTIEDAAAQRDQRVAPAPGILIALHRRRRRAENGERASLPRAHDGDIAAVVARRLFLLVRAVVLFVDDDQPDVRERREHGRAGSDDDVDVAAPDPVPLIVALAVREARYAESRRARRTRGETSARQPA